VSAARALPAVAGRAARHRGPPRSGPCRPASRWCRSNDRHYIDRCGDPLSAAAADDGTQAAS
jgi:hypothetical protein